MHQEPGRSSRYALVMSYMTQSKHPSPSSSRDLTYYILILASNIATARPRCWIGVIDQINPPWVVVSGEHDEEVILSLQRVYSGVKEGDWVMYWTATQRLEPLKSPSAQRETQRLKKLIDELSTPIIDPSRHHEGAERLKLQ